LRVRLNSGAGDANPQIQNSGSRVGISGTHDLGRGLSGFYTWEIGTAITSGAGSAVTGTAGDLELANPAVSTRIGRLGLKGDFGQVQAGSFWTFAYNNVTSATDQGNVNSGNFQGQWSQTRSTRSVEYTTPDFNGFQSALLLQMDGGNGMGLAEDLDQWNIAGVYGVQGFTFGAMYNNWANGYTSGSMGEDKKAWALRGSYSQDNWVVNMVYGADNQSDNIASRPGKGSGAALMHTEDRTLLELHAGVDIDKTSLYALYSVSPGITARHRRNNRTSGVLSARGGNPLSLSHPLLSLGLGCLAFVMTSALGFGFFYQWYYHW